MTKQLTEIECKLRKFVKSPLFPSVKNDKVRAGFYHGSYFWSVKGYGRSKWAIVTHITDVDIDSYLEQNYTEREIVNACLNHLNIKPKRKKYAKKDSKRPYGDLELFRCTLKEDEEQKYFSVIMMTSERKNKSFWGEGQKVTGGRVKRVKKDKK